MDFETLEEQYKNLSYDDFAAACKNLKDDENICSDYWHELGCKILDFDSDYALISFLISASKQLKSENKKPGSFDQIAQIYYHHKDYNKTALYAKHAYDAEPNLERASLLHECYIHLKDPVKEQFWAKIKEKYQGHNLSTKGGAKNALKGGKNTNKVDSAFGLE